MNSQEWKKEHLHSEKKIISRNEIYDELMHARYVLWFIAFFPSNFELFAYFLKRKTQHRTKMKPITVKLHTFSCKNSLKKSTAGERKK